MTTKIQETTIRDTEDGQAIVEMLIADNEDPDIASEFVVIKVQIVRQELEALQSLQLSAFQRVNELLKAQTAPLSKLLNDSL